MIYGKIGLMRKKLKPIVVIGFFLTFFAIIFISGVYGNRATAGKETTITQSNTNPTSIETIPSSSYYITNALEMKPIIDVSAWQRPSEIDYDTLSQNISGAIVRIQSGSHTKNENTATDENGLDKNKISLQYFDATDFSSHQNFYNNLEIKPNVVIYAAGFLAQNNQAFEDFDATFNMIKTN